MNVILECLTRLRATSSTNEKLDILREYADNTLVREYFYLTYEPRINYYVTKVQPEFANEQAQLKFDKTCLNMLAPLRERAVTGHAARAYLANIHEALCDEEKELLELLIGHDVKAGVSVSTVNKVWPGLCTKVPYMRCSLPKHVKLKTWDWDGGVISQIKCDGKFTNTNIKGSYVSFASRGGVPMPIDQLAELAAELRRPELDGQQLHGEMLVVGPDGKVMARELGNGILNSLAQGGEMPEGHKAILVVWDIIPIDKAVTKGKYKVPYVERLNKLTEIFGMDDDEVDASKLVQVVPTEIVNSIQAAYDHYKAMLDLKLEGTVLKRTDAIWEDTTSNGQVKFKLEVTVELRCIGKNPGTGKNAHLFGSIRCQTEDGKLEVSATGFTDKLRAELDDIIVGKIVTVKSNALMFKGDKVSMFLPGFVEVRYDKTVADTLQQVIEQFDNAVETIADLVE